MIMPWRSEARAASKAEATRVLGDFLRDVMKLNLDKQNFRLFGPDETASNRLEAVYRGHRQGMDGGASKTVDIDLSADGRVMEVLSEHLCEGWLEGYLLTGRHGLFSCYEAFIHIIDSMFNQHAKWLKVSREIPWRKPIASLNYLLTSHVWRQDHNGFSHQDPGFIDHVANKKSDVVRIYLPPDANCLLSVADHCLRSRNYINLIVAGKQPEWQWLDMDSAVRHCTRRRGHLALGEQRCRRSRRGHGLRRRRADAGDAGGRDSLARLRPGHPHPRRQRGGPDGAAAADPSIRTAWKTRISTRCSPRDKPVIFAFHGYPAMIHKLTYRRHNHDNIHVRGYREEGTTTTPFDMVVLNNLDRYQLCSTRSSAIPRLGGHGAGRRRITGPWSVTSSTSASTARTCRRFETGGGLHREYSGA